MSTLVCMSYSPLREGSVNFAHKSAFFVHSLYSHIKCDMILYII